MPWSDYLRVYARIMLLTWSLYKHKPESSPEHSFRAEFCQFLVRTVAPNGSQDYFVPTEIHGWWSVEENRAVNKVTRLSPSEGLSLGEARAMLNDALRKRISEGFIYLYGLDPFADGGRVELTLKPTDTLDTIGAG